MTLPLLLDLPGPSRRIRVEPLEAPRPVEAPTRAPEEQPERDDPRVPAPDPREPVPA